MYRDVYGVFIPAVLVVEKKNTITVIEKGRVLKLKDGHVPVAGAGRGWQE